MTNRELGTAIRNDLKANGYKIRDFSVRVRDSLYDTAVDIRIKNPMIRKSEVEKIVKKYEEVDRDAATGEILAGANTYIFTQYEYGIFEEAAAELLPTAEKVLNNKEKYSGRKIAETETKTAHIIHYDGCAWTLAEFNKEENIVREYRPTYWIRCPQDLAIAMWRFKNIGTIYC